MPVNAMRVTDLILSDGHLVEEETLMASLPLKQPLNDAVSEIVEGLVNYGFYIMTFILFFPFLFSTTFLIFFNILSLLTFFFFDLILI
jgi:hypothetical protein